MQSRRSVPIDSIHRRGGGEQLVDHVQVSVSGGHPERRDPIVNWQIGGDVADRCGLHDIGRPGGWQDVDDIGHAEDRRVARGGAARNASGGGRRGGKAMAGLDGGHQQATTLPMWSVEDSARAVDRVLAAGGNSSGVQDRPYAMEAECVDDQGTGCYLGQLQS